MDNGIISNVNRGNFKILNLKTKETINNALWFSSSAIYPVVGDKVDYEYKNNTAIIYNIHPRKNQLSRIVKDSTKFSKVSNIEVFCSNVDYLFIFSSLNNEFNLNNIEKFVNMANLSKVVPVIVLTKLDLCKNGEEKTYIERCINTFNNIDIICISSLNNINMEKLNGYFKNGNIIAILGTSGVGKSTFINSILDKQIRTNEVSKNDNGRHTTTTRTLYITKEGAFIIDLPGIKIINTSSTLTQNYIKELSLLCRKNCSHTVESNCELLKALKNNLITNEELKEFRESFFNEKKQIKSSYEKYTNNKNKRKNIKKLRKEIRLNDDFNEF